MKLSGVELLGTPTEYPGRVTAPGGVTAVMVAVGAAGQVIAEVSEVSAPPGVAVCVQVNVAITAPDNCGTHDNPTAGAFAPTVAGAVIVRVPPVVTKKLEAPVAGIVQPSANDAVATPAVATVTGTVPVPPVRVVGASALTVGAAGVGAAGQVMVDVKLGSAAPAGVAV